MPTQVSSRVIRAGPPSTKRCRASDATLLIDYQSRISPQLDSLQHLLELVLSHIAMASSLSLDNLFGLQGRIALITGGGSGIGWMIARGLATNGVKVYITGRRKHKLDESAASFNQSNQGKGSVVACVFPCSDRSPN